ncbi:imidazole glycerol phosphate synthase subunit HisH [Nanoarchaeota archaeon]
MKVAIVDYGAGNLKSVSKALDFLKVENIITDKPEDILEADKIILPGVGNFGDTMKQLKQKNLIEPIKQAIESGKSYLGICLGLQILFEKSQESSELGLGIFKGKVVKFNSDKLKIPQIGWNNINIKKESKLFDGIDKGYFYFVHSYYVVPEDKDIILTTTDYGGEFVSGIEKNNIYAVQFHPEKSGKVGLRLLRNFIEL